MSTEDDNTAKTAILDHLDERLAEGAALLLKGHLEVALQRAEDQETAAALWHLHRCRLTITADGPRLQLELVAEIAGETRRIYGATFDERGPLQ